MMLLVVGVLAALVGLALLAWFYRHERAPERTTFSSAVPNWKAEDVGERIRMDGGNFVVVRVVSPYVVEVQRVS